MHSLYSYRVCVYTKIHVGSCIRVHLLCTHTSLWVSRWICTPIAISIIDFFSLHLVVECGIHGLVEHQSCNLNNIAVLKQRLPSFQYLRILFFLDTDVFVMNLFWYPKVPCNLCVPFDELLPIDPKNDSFALHWHLHSVPWITSLASI